MAPLPQTRSRRWLNGESLRAVLAVIAVVAGVALLLHAVLATDPSALRLLPAPWQSPTLSAPLAAPLMSPLAGADPASL